MGGLLQWIGKKIKLTDGSFWTYYIGNETWSGKSVTPDTAMNVSAFWAGTRLLAQLGSTLPFKVYDYRDPESAVVARDHPVAKMMRDPNTMQTPAQVLEAIIVGLCINGNGYAEKIMSAASGQVIGLRSIGKARPYFKSGNVWYRFKDPVTGADRDEPADKIFHVKGFGDGSLLEGLSPISYARQTLGLALANDEAASRTFANGGRPGGFFTTPKKLTQDQREQARKTLIEPFEGSENVKKIGILEADVKWQDVAMSPEDTQMLESRRFNVEEVCRWLGVPPIMIGHAASGQTMWGSGVEQILLQFYTTGLRPLLVRIEQEMMRSLFSATDRERYAPKFVVEGLLRADSKARAEFYKIMTFEGLMTRNECRRLENLPESKDAGADSLTVQSSLVLLESLKDEPEPMPAIQQVPAVDVSSPGNDNDQDEDGDETETETGT